MEEVARNMSKTHDNDSASRRWIARLGVGSFIFFFIKGLVWLGIGAGAWVAMSGD